MNASIVSELMFEHGDKIGTMEIAIIFRMHQLLGRSSWSLSLPLSQPLLRLHHLPAIGSEGHLFTVCPFSLALVRPMLRHCLFGDLLPSRASLRDPVLASALPPLTIEAFSPVVLLPHRH